MTDKPCARCKTNPRHVTTGGKQQSWCIDCIRAHEHAKKQRRKQREADARRGPRKIAHVRRFRPPITQRAEGRVLLVFADGRVLLADSRSTTTPKRLADVLAFYAAHGVEIIEVQED